VDLDLNHVAAVWRNMFVVYWLGETNPGAVARVTQHLQRLAAQFGTGIGLMQVVGATTGPPSSEAREALAKMLKGGSAYIVCSSLVVPGVGFRMAAARALATGLIMLARPSFPHEVYSTVEEAAIWHCSLLPPTGSSPVTPSDISSVVRTLQATLGETRPAMRRGS
jgi:hypothetical protein